MKPAITSLSITFVKNQFAEGQVMEIMMILQNGEIATRTFPVDGKTVRVDSDTLSDPVLTVENGEDGA